MPPTNEPILNADLHEEARQPATTSLQRTVLAFSYLRPNCVATLFWSIREAEEFEFRLGELEAVASARKNGHR